MKTFEMKKGNEINIHYNMDGSQNNGAERKKPDQKSMYCMIASL